MFNVALTFNEWRKHENFSDDNNCICGFSTFTFFFFLPSVME